MSRPSRKPSKFDRRLRPVFDNLEDRLVPTGGMGPTLPPPTAVLESFDGTGNNLANPTWGSAGADLVRIAPAAYSDGLSSPAGASRPSARAISNALSTQGDVDIPSTTNLSAF